MRYTLKLAILLTVCLTIGSGHPFAVSRAVLLDGALTRNTQTTQNVEDRITTGTNPPGFSFALKTKSDRKTFHLGEMIEIDEDYSSSVPGRYFVLPCPQKLEGGSPSSLTILPGAAVIDRVHETGKVSAAAILNACPGEGLRSGGGLGPGEGGGFGDCGGLYELRTEPVHFPYVLNYRFGITAPGSYTIQARGANVVSKSDVTKPMLVTSTQLQIEIVRDDNWSHQQLQLAVDRLEETQRKYLVDSGNHTGPVPGEDAQQTETALETEMEKSAEIIRFLDTEESLREAVRLFDGSPRLGIYENPLLNAILESSHRDLAVPLLADRMVDGDFIASVDFIDMLTAMTIQIEEPFTFDRGDLSSRQQLNPRMLEILREYALSLGHSLASKRGPVRESGLATFEHFASEGYCTNEP